jgi:hypothetical protein
MTIKKDANTMHVYPINFKVLFENSSVLSESEMSL